MRPGALTDPFTIFSTSDWDHLMDIRQNGQKERFKISKDVKFERDSLKTNSFNSYNSFTKSPNFTDFFLQTSVKFRDFLEQNLCSLLNLVSFLNLMRSFQQENGYSLTGLNQNLKN